MAKTTLKITRRKFLQLSAAGASGLAVKAKSALASGFEQVGLTAPWFLRGQIETTYNNCDMCPWRCGIVVHSVEGQVHKIDGNPADSFLVGPLADSLPLSSFDDAEAAPPLEIDELVELGALLFLVAAGDRIGHAAGGVLLENGAFHLGEGGFDGLHLGEDVDAIAIVLHHLGDSANLALNTAQAIADLRIVFFHPCSKSRVVIPLGGI